MRSGNLRAHNDTDGLRCPQSPRGRLRVEAAGHPVDKDTAISAFRMSLPSICVTPGSTVVATLTNLSRFLDLSTHPIASNSRFFASATSSSWRLSSKTCDHSITSSPVSRLET